MSQHVTVDNGSKRWKMGPAKKNEAGIIIFNI